ncbi:MAG TPA: CvpA family protein [Candidatus Limnocylindria bacterium]|nr:CvpA family protein [Candidatus Limnocylindria bacterium]
MPNAVDLLIVAALLYAAVAGVRSGFVATLYGLITWIVAIPVALVLQGPFGALLARAGLEAPLARTIAFVLVLLLIEAAFGVLGIVGVRPFVKRIHADRRFGTADRVLGVGPSILRTLVVVAVALTAALVLPVGHDVRASIDASRIAQALVAQVAAVQPALGALAGGPEDGAPLVVTKLGADQSQTLDLPDALTLVADPAAEDEMLRLLNAERTSRDLLPLALDPRLVPIARQHSEEMFRLKYFGHQSPVTGSPFDRLATAKISYSRAGENLAYAHSVAVAHRGLMDSEGHRENILRPEFTRIGIGVVAAGSYGRMFTQLFMTP